MQITKDNFHKLQIGDLLEFNDLDCTELDEGLSEHLILLVVKASGVYCSAKIINVITPSEHPDGYCHKPDGMIRFYCDNSDIEYIKLLD